MAVQIFVVVVPGSRVYKIINQNTDCVRDDLGKWGCMLAGYTLYIIINLFYYRSLSVGARNQCQGRLLPSLLRL